MPFYEYECSSCKYYTEVLQKLSDAPLRKCPSCGKNTFKKLVSAPVFRLKGSGWYETDFKGDKDSKRNLAGAERDESKPADDKPAGDKPAGDKKDATKADTVKADAAKADTTKAEPSKPAADKSAAAPKPATRSRRGEPAPRARPAPVKTAKKKVRR